MKGKKKISLISLTNLVAVAIVAQTVNTACIWHFHQPTVPAKAINYKKK